MNSPYTDPAIYVSKFINHTSKNVFLTGKAGSGKTTLLKQIVNNTFKKCLIVAPTGIAAINAGGVTIHSLFQLPFGCFIPVNQPAPTQTYIKLNDPISVIKNLQMYDSKRKLLREIELLIIDEVSMLRADLLDAIDLVLRHVRRNGFPFGGVQVLFIGDMLQLPPVIKDNEWEVLKTYYKSIYFFDAQVLQKSNPVYIELDKIYRQTDERFLNLLNHLRDNKLNQQDYDLLNTHYQPNFKSESADGCITLTTHNYKATELNKNLLNQLAGKSYFFDASIEGDFNEYAHPLEKTLELKIGAQVMFVKNDPTGSQRFFNGKIGKVFKIENDVIEVKDAEGTLITVSKYEWANIKYKLNVSSNEIEENIVGTFTHYPLKLAWAITVHKSQGLTFDKAIIDIGEAFAPGQVYVALSRLRSLEGLILKSPIQTNSVQLDEKIHSYASAQTSTQNLNELLNQETYLFLKNYLLKCFEFSAFVRKVEEHTDSYTKDEKKSIKKKYYTWAKDVEKEVTEIKPAADKFKQQIITILDSKKEDQLSFLQQRVMAASAYFLPFLKSFSNAIFRHAEIIKSEKKIKTYFTELIALEGVIFEQHSLIKKASLLIAAVLTNKEITSEEIKKAVHDIHRAEQINQLYSNTTNLNTKIKSIAGKGKSEKKSTLSKTEKLDTKEESLNLYKAGNTIDDIAKLRVLSNSTIEGHLAYYVTKSKLKATAFVSDEKIENILTVSKTLNTLNLTPIKQALGEDYTYSDIRFAIASHLSSE